MIYVLFSTVGDSHSNISQLSKICSNDALFISVFRIHTVVVLDFLQKVESVEWKTISERTLNDDTFYFIYSDSYSNSVLCRDDVSRSTSSCSCLVVSLSCHSPIVG